ncbi:hypothetical protein LPB72_16950 [Hydrogenophaga crassostreae]|uniref:DUF5648 domain-containing protein n=1 Tax=Hydrogenophaga crassostreae TaxID=1763535 RepID=A0A167HA48_9BURK|nr:FG-GAP-like repeat-containing protein [Hydrogenophaga crassostreae]AOW12706.1 hypothetical protein LPB072_07470 [Hydrogenophaga crassostreae]OAD40578.1 hypothetical protein LPB72_16950 [Hydrogenophaga crassostreae]
MALALAACGGGNSDLPQPGPTANAAQTSNNTSTKALLTKAAELSRAELQRAASETSSEQRMAAPVQKAAPGTLVSVHRFFNTLTGAHFYTISETEKQTVQNTLHQFQYEGPGFAASSAPAEGLSPVYRFFNVDTGVHLYTISEDERALVQARLPQFAFEGVAYFASKTSGSDRVPLYRFFLGDKGYHFYSNSATERDTIVNTLPQYTFEGIGYFVFASSAVVPAAVTSYKNFKAIGLVPQVLPFGDNTIRAYGNFSGNGHLDFFRAVGTYDVRLPESQATPSRFEFFARQPDGSLVQTSTLLAQANGCLHPRKALVADFNRDNRPDIFVVCHGYDTHPFPGERNKLVVSQANGTYTVRDASNDVGFFHGGTAADIDGDGDVDVIVVNNFEADRAITLLNDGAGFFTRETPSRLPSSIRNAGNYYSIELIDVDEDGLLDLLLAGHEFDAAPTSIFLNPGAGNFSAATALHLPAVPNEGVVLDFTVTGSGANRAVWLVRTSGGDGTFYQSNVVQKVSFPSMASSIVLNRRPSTWIPWLIPAYVNGAHIVTTDNIEDKLSFPQ